MDKTIILNTWDENKNKKFMYVKTNSDSYILLYGKDFSNYIEITKLEIERIKTQFQGKSIKLSASRTPDEGSFGHWLIDNITGGTVIASYLGPLLINEGFATKDISGKNINFI